MTAVAIAADTGVAVVACFDMACGQMLLVRTADGDTADRQIPIPPGAMSEWP